MHSQLFLLPGATRGTLQRTTLTFRCEGAVPGFHVHRLGDKDPGGVLAVCRTKKALNHMCSRGAVFVL